MITISMALASLRPGAEWVIHNNSYAELTWLDSNQSQPTEEEVNAEIVRLTEQSPYDACKEEAKRLIAASDWSVLPDVGISNVSEFEAYRAQLRALIKSPVANPTFPTEPQPVWI